MRVSCRQPARGRDAIRPVTIRQLARTKIKKELTKIGALSRYSLDGEEFSIVGSVLTPGSFSMDLISSLQATFVGNIISVEVSGETTLTIRIEDGTGRITSKQRITEDPPRWSISRSSGFGETDPVTIQGRCVCTSVWSAQQIQGNCDV